MNKKEFCNRFIKEYDRIVGYRNFKDRSAITSYATYTAVEYWDEIEEFKDIDWSPEECAAHCLHSSE